VGTDPTPQTAAIQPAGLPDLAASISYGEPPPAEWLSVELQSGSSLLLNVDTQGLSPGAYQALVTVESSSPDHLAGQAMIDLTVTP
jgi:hypothetical protein